MRNDEKSGEMSAGTRKGFDLYGYSENFLNKNEAGFVENDDMDSRWREDREDWRTRDHSSWGNDSIEGNLNVGGGEGHIVNLGIGHCSFESAGSIEDSEVVNREVEKDFESPGGDKLVDGCSEGLHLSSGLERHAGDAWMKMRPHWDIFLILIESPRACLQEGEIERCKSCNSPFHQLCFSKVVTCPCACLHTEMAKRSTTKLGNKIGR